MGTGKSGGMKVDITPAGDSSMHVEGEVRFMDNAVDAATGTILMKAIVSNDDEKLTPGQFLNVTLLLNTLDNAVTVPNEAVQQGAEGNFLYVVKEDSTVEMRRIETVASNKGVTAIGSGLKPGETVVTDGQLRLTPGTKVKIREPGSGDQKGKNDKSVATAPTPAPKEK